MTINIRPVWLNDVTVSCGCVMAHLLDNRIQITAWKPHVTWVWGLACKSGAFTVQKKSSSPLYRPKKSDYSAGTKVCSVLTVGAWLDGDSIAASPTVFKIRPFHCSSCDNSVRQSPWRCAAIRRSVSSLWRLAALKLPNGPRSCSLQHF